MCRHTWMIALLLLTMMGFPTALSWAANPFDQLRISRELAGTTMPPFTLEALDGTQVHSSQLKGQIVLLNFWATWCGPCKEEMPALATLNQHFSNTDFLLLTITADLQPEAIQAFLNILKVDFPVLLDKTNAVSHAYMARALPLTVLIDKEGKLIGKAMGPRDWDSPDAIAMIEHLLETSNPTSILQ
ncbi:TlpA family protein disulfide reductase [Nitrospira sp. M1]